MDAPEGAVPLIGRQRGAARSLLKRNRDFRRLFIASVVSFGGDWFLFVALAGLVFDLTGSPALVAGVYVATTVPFALFSFIGGPLADRLNRQRLMVGADLCRGVLALGFFLIRSPSQVWLVFVLAGAIAALGAVFGPASSAAVPNLVDREDLPIATVVFAATWGTMLAVGSALGGLVVALLGRKAGYVGDSISFFFSAAMITTIRRPFSEPREERTEHPGLVEATRETFRYARRDSRVLALLSVKGGFGLGAGVIAMLPVLALDVFHTGDRGTGLLYGFRGLGVLIGPFLARRFMREDDLRPLFWAIGASFAVYGVFYAFVPLAPTILIAGLFVLCAHLGGGAQWALSTYGLQIIVPDWIRGRVFAFDEALVTLTLAISATLAGLAADHVPVRDVMFALACVAMVYALIWTLATRGIRRSLPRAPAGGPLPRAA